MDYKIIRKIAKDCFTIDAGKYPRTSVLTIAHDNDRSLLFKGKYYSPLINTMEDDLAKLGIKCVSIARIISTIKGDLSYGQVYSPDGSFARALLLKRLWGFLFSKKYSYSSMEERIWGDILDKTGAKYVFGIQPSRELCVACHRRGIWVADVQHGVIADTHPWYGESFRSVDPVEYLPNAFLCWDFGSQEVIDKWAKKKCIDTHVIGNRWIARFMERADDDSLVSELYVDFSQKSLNSSNRKTILLSLSWGDYNIPNGFMVDGIQAAIKNTANRYRWLIRLHPNQVKGFASDEGPRFVSFFNDNLSGFAEWEVTTRAPLPVVLNEVDLHLSWNSSVSIEAAQFGVKTALLDPRLRQIDQRGDYYTYYRKAGLIDLISETEVSISTWIEENLESKRTAENYSNFNVEYQKILKRLSS